VLSGNAFNLERDAHICAGVPSNKRPQHAEPYLFYIMQQIEKRNLPGELALLPMIESHYKMHGLSDKGATGIWQINAITCRHLGLTQDRWIDSRKDIEASTGAALDYLEDLYRRYQNWALAFAAYNCGPGKLNKAIALNKKQNKPTDFWSLTSLPKQTRHYVPKLLAMARIFRYPVHYGITIMPIKNKPYFTALKTLYTLDLKTLSKVANADYDVLKKLNADCKWDHTHPYQAHRVLVPAHLAAHIERILLTGKIPKAKPKLPKRYRVQKGDNLTKLAKTFSTSIQEIKTQNALSSNSIRIGQWLQIPYS